jgi:glycerol-3-phosphate dehydrogenase
MARRPNKKIVTALACVASGAVGLGAYNYYKRKTPVLQAAAKPSTWLSELPSREAQVEALSATPEYDMLVIGGGATGAGVAVDAASRGLKTALVEKYDFSSGTSSRSTKLIHGGVRYLQKAIMGLDFEQYRMVKEALHERANLIEIAPHLSYPFPIMLPLYKLWQIPYYWAGIKAYDLVAGSQTLKSSYYINKERALELFPMLKKDELCGAIVYYDGQHNDARMNISMALTAARLGANVANYVAVTELLHETDANGNKRVIGAKCLDKYGNKEFTIRAKCVVNATGPYTDTIRQMDNSETKKICQPSSGVHIVLPDYYSPTNMGLLDPHTSDGRVIFFLPWQKHTMAGTTDSPCQITESPVPAEEDVNFIMNEIKNYLNPDVQVRRGDVLSAWCGIRPLVSDPNKADTQSLARNHIIHISDNKLVTIAGGKWTTYRSMAEETVDAAIKACGLKPKNGCVTTGLFLEGGHNWTPTSFIRLVQDYGLETEVAIHLSNTYGDQADKVAELSSLTGKRWPVVGVRLHPEFPYIESEVRYAVKEYARTAIDVLARRTRISFLNVLAADEALPAIIDIMGSELKWSKQKQQEELEKAKEFLKREMGLNLKYQMKTNVPINFSKDEISTYIKRFRSLDVSNKGYITHKDLKAFFKESMEEIPEDELHLLLTEVDTNKNGLIELDEFLQLMSAMKTGAIGSARFSKVNSIKTKINTVRSGGGV